MKMVTKFYSLSNKQQVMMEWERPYMEASIDVVEANGRRIRNRFWMRVLGNTILCPINPKVIQ